MNRIYLASYRPLARNNNGVKVAAENNIPPYVDDSIRREPDFESVYPSITALCRGRIFAPKLEEGDVVVYITHKNRYSGMMYPGWRITAILEVTKRLESHIEAAKWYRDQNLPLPGNCMVEDNPPLSVELTSGAIKLSQRGWDIAYKRRASQHGIFLACKPIFLELFDPPILTENMMWEIFGRIPVTRNPPKITEVQYEKLLVISGIR